MLRLADLFARPIRGAFDLKHLQEIHHYIFQDVYEWAGQLRTVNIAKSNMFCLAEYITKNATDLFQELKHERYLQGLSEDELIHKLSKYFSEINAIHPFREGNGRSQREFIRILALMNGYRIDFHKASRDEMLSASLSSFNMEYGDMERSFHKCIQPISTEQNEFIRLSMDI